LRYLEEGKKKIFPYRAKWPEEEAVIAEWNSQMFGNGAANRHRKALFIFSTDYNTMYLQSSRK